MALGEETCLMVCATPYCYPMFAISTSSLAPSVLPMLR